MSLPPEDMEKLRSLPIITTATVMEAFKLEAREARKFLRKLAREGILTVENSTRRRKAYLLS